MNREDYSFIAEALLALCEKDRQSPFVSERRLEQKIRKDQQQDELALQLARKQPDDALLESECLEIVNLAKLTHRQTHVFHLRLQGHTFDEIGKGAGHSKQGAQSIFIQALKKIVRAFRVYPYTGLSDVYRWEVHRGAR
jgi:DNA-directed RNA polymerase sigma subunit (sigma70/sigma32)